MISQRHFDLYLIFLMAKDWEVPKVPFGHWDSSVENSLFRSVSHHLIGLFDILVSSFLSSLHILEIRPLSDVGLMIILLSYYHDIVIKYKYNCLCNSGLICTYCNAIFSLFANLSFLWIWNLLKMHGHLIIH